MVRGLSSDSHNEGVVPRGGTAKAVPPLVPAQGEVPPDVARWGPQRWGLLPSGSFWKFALDEEKGPLRILSAMTGGVCC